MSEDLKEGYYALRHSSRGLKELSHHFEGMPWREEKTRISRMSSDGDWKLSVYRVEGDIEACVTKPDGESVTFS